MVQYCRAPTMLLYKDGSKKGTPSYKDKEDEVPIRQKHAYSQTFEPDEVDQQYTCVDIDASMMEYK